MVIQKLIRVVNDDTAELDNFLADKWKITQISAVGTGYQTACYVLLEKLLGCRLFLLFWGQPGKL